MSRFEFSEIAISWEKHPYIEVFGDVSSGKSALMARLAADYVLKTGKKVLWVIVPPNNDLQFGIYLNAGRFGLAEKLSTLDLTGKEDAYCVFDFIQNFVVSEKMGIKSGLEEFGAVFVDGIDNILGFKSHTHAQDFAAEVLPWFKKNGKTFVASYKGVFDDTDMLRNSSPAPLSRNADFVIETRRRIAYNDGNPITRIFAKITPRKKFFLRTKTESVEAIKINPEPDNWRGGGELYEDY
jgi:GTPase SAR1 family protein